MLILYEIKDTTESSTSVDILLNIDAGGKLTRDP
jgi:hypothetical protein